jgi:hypothetical protein
MDLVSVFCKYPLLSTTFVFSPSYVFDTIETIPGMGEEGDKREQWRG